MNILPGQAIRFFFFYAVYTFSGKTNFVIAVLYKKQINGLINKNPS